MSICKQKKLTHSTRGLSDDLVAADRDDWCRYGQKELVIWIHLYFEACFFGHLNRIEKIVSQNTVCLCKMISKMSRSGCALGSYKTACTPMQSTDYRVSCSRNVYRILMPSVPNIVGCSVYLWFKTVGLYVS